MVSITTAVLVTALAGVGQPVEAKEVSRDAYETHLRHIADEQGRDFDPKSIGDGPYRVLQVKGTGAEVCR